jgi:hypothetical protein
MQFSYAGDLTAAAASPGGFVGAQFTITSGALTLSSTTSAIRFIQVLAVGPTGTPTQWYFCLESPSTAPLYLMWSINEGDSTEDGIAYYPTPDPAIFAATYTYVSSTGSGWTRTLVPAPATLILFGSGLAGLAATKKRKRNQQTRMD